MAFGGATPTEPKSISPTDPAARYTAAADTPAVSAYSDNYLVDLKHAVIVDVEATTAVRQAEVGAAKTMLDRTAERLDVTPSRVVADAGIRLGPRASAVGLTTIRRAELTDQQASLTAANDLAIRRVLETAGIEFIGENGGGVGVRLRYPHRDNKDTPDCIANGLTREVLGLSWK
jgi:hypothetical protein